MWVNPEYAEKELKEKQARKRVLLKELAEIEARIPILEAKIRFCYSKRKDVKRM